MIKLIPIKPKVTQATFAAVVKAVAAQTRISAEALVEDHTKTTATWEHQPRWIVRASTAEVSVRTDDEIWRYVDQGTRPHIIRPRRARVLAFQGGYTAKTRVGSIIARAGGPSGDTVFARQVNHPGTKARGFSHRLRAKWKEKWPQDMQTAITRAMQ